VARLAGFPAIFPRFRRSPLAEAAISIKKPAIVFSLEDKIGNRIVNNIDCGYHPKKCARSRNTRQRGTVAA
jgi:hypothetical protein